MKLSHFLICSVVFVAAVSGTAIIDPSLQQRFLGGGGGDTQNVMVSFTQDISSVINRINSMSFPDSAAKRTALTQAQQTFTNGAQAPLKAYLNTRGVTTFESFWINNKMIIPNANFQLVNGIASVPGVAKIEKEPVVHINPMNVGEPEDFDSKTSGRAGRQASADVQWGVKKIRADQVWDEYDGEGVVVANIDTGVRYTHETLRARWRSVYGWFDPYLRTQRPNDKNGHGTHTMGTIAGSKGIGVAPGATWIACKGCGLLSCTGAALTKCGEWIQCPTTWLDTKPNCKMAPDVVSNSWGGDQDSDWYNGIVKSWHAANIIPVFSIGNSGPKCATARSPGDQPDLISVGSTTENDTISEFSSVGATKDLRIKPEISAPGDEVRSAYILNDSSYISMSGTSMACPHVAGVIALMREKIRQVKYDKVFNAITTTAVQSLVVGDAPKSCNGTSISSWPNNVFGYGRIDALDSVNALA